MAESLSPRHRAMLARAKRWRFMVETRTTPRAVLDAYRAWCEAEGRPAVTALVYRKLGRGAVVVKLPAGMLFDEDDASLDHTGLGDAWWGTDRTWVGSEWLPPDEALAVAWRVGEWADGFCRAETEGGE